MNTSGPPGTHPPLEPKILRTISHLGRAGSPGPGPGPGGDKKGGMPGSQREELGVRTELTPTRLGLTDYIQNLHSSWPLSFPLDHELPEGTACIFPILGSPQPKMTPLKNVCRKNK